jgi:protein TonB
MNTLRILRQVDPLYPPFARMAHIQGAVVLLMTIDEQGIPADIQVIEGHMALLEEALRAARQWRFEPARADGRPVPATFKLTLNFRLK